MKTARKNQSRSILSRATILASAALLSLCSTNAALAKGKEVSHYSGTTYGKPSGGRPFLNQGLLLELVDGQGENPRIRMFGGTPESMAAITFSSSITGSDTGVLVGTPEHLVNGTFDWNGYVEFPLSALKDRMSAGAPLYAQGVQLGTSGVDPFGWAGIEYSNGVAVTPRAEQEVPKLTLSDFAPRLPERRVDEVNDALYDFEMIQALRTALNSAGDEVKLELNAKLNVAVVAAVNLGGKIKLTVGVKRTGDDQYDLYLDQEVAGTAGVELVDGVEAEASVPMACQQIYRFHSVDGVVRGMKGLIFALNYPGLSVGDVIDMEKVTDTARQSLLVAKQVAEEVIARTSETREKMDAARARFSSAIEQNFQNAERAYLNARAVYNRARAAYNASRWKNPVVIRVLNAAGRAMNRAYSIYLTARTIYVELRGRFEQARDRFNEMVNLEAVALRAVDEAYQAVSAGLEAVLTLTRSLWTLGQIRSFVADHFHGLEYRMGQGIDISAKFKIPGIDSDILGGGAAAGMKVLAIVKMEKPLTRNTKITVTRKFERSGEIGASAKAEGVGSLSVNYKKVSGLSLSNSFGLENGRFRQFESIAALTIDDCIGGSAKLDLDPGNIGGKRALGRTRKIYIQQEDLARKLGTAILDVFHLSTEGLQNLFGSTAVGFSIQDRREAISDFDLSGSICGYGAGIGYAFTWTDQGDELKREITFRKALDTILGKIQDAVDDAQDAGQNLRERLTDLQGSVTAYLDTWGRALEEHLSS